MEHLDEALQRYSHSRLWRSCAASAVQAAELKVAYLPCGNVNDKSWSEEWLSWRFKMLRSTLAASGTTMKLDYTESLPPSQVEAAARDYASRGYDIIVFCIVERLL